MSNYAIHNATPETATDKQIEQAQKQIHTALPAKVVSFNPQNQTVTLAVQIQQILVKGENVNIPPLVDVPVSYPRGGGFAVTFPLKAGDEGLAVFSERCIDGWWQSGKASPPLDYRLHDLSDACFIPGICSLPNVVGNFFTGGLSMQTLDGSTFIRITNGTILIQGNIEHQGSQHTSGQISSDSDVVSAGISGKSHTHKGDSGGTTGKPQ
ncbi:Gp138 family membrane-puncturing spike protein [Lonepinella koalarum]|uniref:Phage protein Gp138 N-terminal domain-containing protein n=1 Tax=Lonepinella koalarum TaxID=53417 RepID=A0A4R1KSV6_9PAST|nr:Gp138 family membrane-puncturing spike protein [Lonepinella koalarum]MDH2927216.1 baseplate protein [Lonepinella koalarum]TCK68114.1 hypothetical protein EV692_1813 [Lonepinella koalarum]TFJ89486.1 baseplate protein [Lonepinella koalarum]